MINKTVNAMGDACPLPVVKAKNAIKDYPYSKYKEDLELLVLKARFQEAENSVDERKADRFRDVVDEYYSFINVTAFAKMIGINGSLMRQYKKGDTYISSSQLEKIQTFVNKMGADFQNLRLA